MRPSGTLHAKRLSLSDSESTLSKHTREWVWTQVARFSRKWRIFAKVAIRARRSINKSGLESVRMSSSVSWVCTAKSSAE